MTTIGLIVNPVAGLGGTVGLKGTDGADTPSRALALGAVPRARERAVAALRQLRTRAHVTRVLTAAADMGEWAVSDAGLEPEVVHRPATDITAPGDTAAAAGAMARADILMFVGGDGTARDVFDAVGKRRPVIGIPAGVKMHSAVFGHTARSAGDAAAAFLVGTAALAPAEVMDRVAGTGESLRTVLHGYMSVPFVPARVQRGKMGTSTAAGHDPAGIAEQLAATREPDGVDVVGPGTTTEAVLRHTGVRAPRTGVTVVDADGLLAGDADATRIDRLTDGRPTRVIVSPIGGQGFVLGRGNQQLTPRLLREVGRANIVIISGESKLAALGGQPLRVDTGDEDVDRMLSGYSPVLIGATRRVMYRIGAI